MELGEDSIRFLVARFARLRASFGEALGEPELIEPSGRHFPDEFRLDAPSVARLFRRMMSYAPLSEDLGVELAFVQDEGEHAGGGCGSGACGTGAKIKARDGVVELEDGYRVELKIGEVGNPVLLTTTLARSIGALVLAEADEEVDAREASAMSEISAAVCGFGVLLLCGSAVYGKGCGGLRLHQATTLSVHELALVNALFLRVHGIKPGAARAHLEITQREALDEAMRIVDSNESLVRALRDAPEELVDGLFEIEPERGLIARLFSKKPADELAPVSKTPKRVRTPEEERRLAEARALVEEALGEE
jgi:hypothetical protein